MKDKVLPNNSQVKFKKTEVEEHPRIYRISNQTKSVTACNDSLNSRTSNVNAVCATCGKCVFNSNHEYCEIQDLKAQLLDKNIAISELKKLIEKCTEISRSKGLLASKSESQSFILGWSILMMRIWEGCISENLRVLLRSSGKDLLTGNRGTDLYTISLQETTSSTPICLMAKASPTQAWLWHRRLSHLNFDYINLLSKKDVVIGLPKLNMSRLQTMFLL
ncbi:retrovirus-related pol polyprotein from transposon TNT 1-94 [Tanacetum coccineum]